METLRETIYSTPIIDHHAHNLLTPSHIGKHNLLSITSEASGPALDHSESTLAHIRAVRQLSKILNCRSDWRLVQEAIEARREEPDDAWAQRCFSGVETALIDDGLDPEGIHPYQWHDRLTHSPCKRIVRIEREAETIIDTFLQSCRKEQKTAGEFQQAVYNSYMDVIDAAIKDPNVAGFKSVICYRSGLALPFAKPQWIDKLKLIYTDESVTSFSRLEDAELGPLFVQVAASLITEAKSHKPMQFHTGLGDNDINLDLSNPAHLQPFIETYPELNIVLLHASYPFTTQAGYLASVYKNTYLDIGEVFPFLSQDGQERVIREALDLCPSEKLLWSTDGHWFPETYLLAIDQVREGLDNVLSGYVARSAMSVGSAKRIVRDLLFNTANTLYKLDLALLPLSLPLLGNSPAFSTTMKHNPWSSNLRLLEDFIQRNPLIRFLRLQWLDYTATPRTRILPLLQALKLFRAQKCLRLVQATLGMLQTDEMCPGSLPAGSFAVYPDFQGLRLGSRAGYATVQCEFREEESLEEIEIDPRTLLRRQVEKGKANGLEFLTGFEIEVVFMSQTVVEGQTRYGLSQTHTGGHAWSTSRALHNNHILDLLESIASKFEIAGIELDQFHAESAPGQFEIILGPLPPLEAVDTLIAAREIISSEASNAGLRATLFPKPFPEAGGTGAHIHLSMTPEDKWQNFYAGVLKNLQSMSALLYSNDASYDRVADGVWAGSTWIAWGPQNRETPLRQIESSHFEIKCNDGLSNPYLVLAAIIGTGLQGVQNETPLTMKPCLIDPAQLSDEERKDHGIRENFPTGILSALSRLRDGDLPTVLGEKALERYITVKQHEHKMLSGMGEEARRHWLIERY